MSQMAQLFSMCPGVIRDIIFLGRVHLVEVFQMPLQQMGVVIQLQIFPQEPTPLSYQITAEGAQQHKQ